MQLHPSLSRQMTLTRQSEAHAAAEHARLVRAVRCASAPPTDVRRLTALRRRCDDPAWA
jgi:hypothetical protein